MITKIHKLLAITAIMAIAITGCKEDEPETYWYNFGTYYETDENASGFFVAFDNGDRLIPTGLDYKDPNVKDSSRVKATFTIETENDSIYTGSVSSVEKILTKNVIQLTEAIEDSIGNDDISIFDEDIWFSEFHLNIIFGYYGAAKTHYINLVKPIGNQTDSLGRQILEFRHNDNNDYMSYYYSSIVSFDMRSLYADGMDSVNFVMQWIDFNNRTNSWNGTYHFTSNNTGKSNIVAKRLY